MRTAGEIMELSGRYAEQARMIRKTAMVLAMAAEMPYGEVMAMTHDERILLGEVLEERAKAMESKSHGR